MAQSIPEETRREEFSSSEAELAQLPQLPPGVFIPAPGRIPRHKTRWPDVIDVIFEKDPACRTIFEALIYQRSEEHTSELQSHSDLVCRLLLEKKKAPLCDSLLTTTR